MLLHQYSWNSEVETTWISLIGWPHKTSIALQYNCYARYTYYGHTLELEQNTSGLLKVCLQL